MKTRRAFLKTTAISGVALFSNSSMALARAPLSFMEDVNFRARAAKIHANSLTIDSHTDTPLMMRREEWNVGERNDSRKGGGKVDFPRMKEGGLDAAFFAAYIGQGERSSEGNARAKKRILRLLQATHKGIEENRELVELATSAADAKRIADTGKRAIYVGMENGYPIGKELTNLMEFYGLGVRYVTLCHTANNAICDSSTDKKGQEWGGLSEFGKDVVREMNRIGMMVDVSHVSDDSVSDVLKLSGAPIIASHSCAKAVCNHPRNLNNELLKEIARQGGVVQVCILSSYVKKPAPIPERDAALADWRRRFQNFDAMTEEEKAAARREKAALKKRFPRQLPTVKDFVDHIDHMVDLMGVDHVGIGTDFDGGGALADCYDVTEISNITTELVRRNYSEEDIAKIWGRNLLGVFEDVEKYAQSQRID